MKRAGLSTGLYDCRREDGSTALITVDFPVAKMRREFDPEVTAIVWVPRAAMLDRVDTMRFFTSHERTA